MAYNYQLTAETVPLGYVLPPVATNFTASGLSAVEVVTRSNRWLLAANRALNTYDLRLTLQGPVIQRGRTNDVLGTPKTFRTLISGVNLSVTNGWFFIQPATYVQWRP
jgi:hypothetical protein